MISFDKHKSAIITRNETLICLVAAGVLVFSHILSLFNGTLRLFITLPFHLDTLFVYGIFLLLVLLSIKTILKRSSFNVWAIIIFILAWFLMTIIIIGDYYDYFIEIGRIFLVASAPWIFVAYAVRDYKLFKKYLNIVALIIVISILANLFVFKTDVFAESSYTQYYTYAILPAAIIFCSNLFDRINAIDLVLVTFSVLFMLAMGARGPLLCVLLFVLLKLMVNYRLQPKKALLVNTVLIVAGVTLYNYFYQILNFLLGILQNLNLSIRTVTRLIEGTFLEDNARNLLSKYSLDLIKDHPLLGVGIGNDRILLASKMQAGSMNEIIGWYPHNIFLEVVLHFGFVIGGVIILYMVKVIFTAIFQNPDKEAVDIICIFTGVGFFPLLFSGSYFTSSLFFALMGFCLYQYKVIRGNKPLKREFG